MCEASAIVGVGDRIVKLAALFDTVSNSLVTKTAPIKPIDYGVDSSVIELYPILVSTLARIISPLLFLHK